MAFTEGDRVIMRAVADRVAIAIENARLFEETQSSLSETFTLYQLSRYLNEADSLEDILQAIIVSVMPDAVSGQIGVFDDYLTHAAASGIHGGLGGQRRGTVLARCSGTHTALRRPPSCCAKCSRTR